MHNIPPQNIEAEQSVLGSMLLDSEVVLIAKDMLSSADFYRAEHSIIFDAILEVEQAGQPVDILTVTEQLKSKPGVDITYILSLANSIPTTANTEAYIKIVQEKATLRRMINTMTKLVQRAYQNDFTDTDTFFSDAEQQVFDIRQKVSQGPKGIKELIPEGLETMLTRKANQGVTGLSTGFKDLDIWTTGLHPENLIILAARPSMGKTSLATQLVVNAARQNVPSILFSLEVSDKANIEKMIVQESRVNSQRVRLGALAIEEEGLITKAAGQLYEYPIYIDDTANITVEQIRSRCRRLRGLGLVVVDYIQLMNATKGENRNLELTYITRQLKLLAREIKAPVIALSQLSRSVEARADKKPMLSDLRESGAIEQDADMVCFIYRDSYYNQSEDRTTELIIAKQRFGPTGTVKLCWLPEYTRFNDFYKGV